MVFSELFFLFVFIPLFALLYMLAAYVDRTRVKGEALRHPNRMKNIVIVIFSLFFYAWGEPIYVFVMLASVLINYIAGRIIDRQEKQRKSALIVGLVCNLGVLGVFKYAGFFAETLQQLGLDIPRPSIALPIGISFYTFQSISYLVDVYRRQSPAQKRYSDLLLYISMFPQLVAGPIVRYQTVADEIGNRKVSAQDFAEGTYRFFIGLGKKVIIANQLSEISTHFLASSDMSDLSTAGAWVGLLAFTFQIYYDFSGYSDMAIGIGRCLGFHFLENFNHPYCCSSITDFWRRWHISLGTFFRDYVYIPMGGNRQHQVLNLFVVWFLTGMWHGANWNFILWGLYFGLFVTIEKYTILRIKSKAAAPLLHLYSLIVVVLGWGLFYYVDLSRLGEFVPILFGKTQTMSDITVSNALTDNFWLWIAAIVFSLPVRQMLEQGMSGLLEHRSPRLYSAGQLIYRTCVVIGILTISVALLVGATNNPFLYTRF
ncbi:MBOAT family protein [Porphyromonas sp.]|uniref:MBOAT family O-acyltransferase n=1 Tax=Porphyromonas sp. TaxID=1924944 RepID=UPI0026DD2275|nr:MBOAT family O-acyltransferase [Porphyromonas sp.]MDO4771428.1 MBOAT family O-acyltransferase [Porphyromonas sp.]